MTENKPQLIYNFLNTHITDPTFLTAEFFVEPNSIMFSQNDNYVEHGEITCYDVNNSFITTADGLVVTPMMLLKNLNDKRRYDMFENFTNGFMHFVDNEQWRIQSISGLDNVFTKELDFKDGYTGSGTDKISITCLDDVNLSMYSLFTLYKECIYDYNNKRQILPNNILQFEATIYIYDVRDLVHYSDYNGYTTDNTAKTTTAVFSYTQSEFDARENFKKGDSFLKPIVCLRFSNCHFDLSSMNKSFENVSVNGGFDTSSSFTFDFTYGKVFINRVSSYMLQSKISSEKVGENSTGDNLYGKQTTKIEPGNTGNATSNINTSSTEVNQNTGQSKTEEVANKSMESTKSNSSSSIGKTSMASKLGNVLNSKKDQFGNEIQSKVNTLANAPKKAIESNLYGAINKASAAVSESINSVEQQIEGKLTEAINAITDSITQTTGKFVGFNIFENLPSGPKKQ